MKVDLCRFRLNKEVIYVLEAVSGGRLTCCGTSGGRGGGDSGGSISDIIWIVIALPPVGLVLAGLLVFLGRTLISLYGFLEGCFWNLGLYQTPWQPLLSYSISEFLAFAVMLILGGALLGVASLFRDEYERLSFGEFVFIVTIIPCVLLLAGLLIFIGTAIWGGVVSLYAFFEGWFRGLWWPFPFVMSLTLTVATLLGALVALVVVWLVVSAAGEAEAVPDTPQPPPNSDEMAIIALSWAPPQKHSTSGAAAK